MALQNSKPPLNCLQEWLVQYRDLLSDVNKAIGDAILMGEHEVSIEAPVSQVHQYTFWKMIFFQGFHYLVRVQVGEGSSQLTGSLHATIGGEHGLTPDLTIYRLGYHLISIYFFCHGLKVKGMKIETFLYLHFSFKSTHLIKNLLKSVISTFFIHCYIPFVCLLEQFF